MDYFLNPKINANQCQLCCCCLDWLESWYLYFKNKKFGSKIKNWTLASVLEKCCFDPIQITKLLSSFYFWSSSYEDIWHVLFRNDDV